MTTTCVSASTASMCETCEKVQVSQHKSEVEVRAVSVQARGNLEASSVQTSWTPGLLDRRAWTLDLSLELMRHPPGASTSSRTLSATHAIQTCHLHDAFTQTRSCLIIALLGLIFSRLLLRPLTFVSPCCVTLRWHFGLDSSLPNPLPNLFKIM